MIVSELFENLSYGELSNLSMSLEGSGEIRAEDQSKLVRYTNQALKLIYARFPHNRDYVNIRLSEGRHKYPLQTKYTVSANEVAADQQFILDSVTEPFEGNLLKIIGIRQEDIETTLIDETKPLKINSRYGIFSVQTLTYDTLYVGDPVDGAELRIEYQATHPRLTMPPDLTEVINLFPLLEEALELKVAARVYSSMNGEEYAAKASRLDAEYESVCQLIETKDLLQLSSSTEHDKLTNQGFV